MSELEILTPEPSTAVLPHSGEIISRDDPLGCARKLAEIRALEWRLKTAKRWLQDAVAEEAARQGTKTLYMEDLKMVVSDSPDIEWDVTELIKLLDLGLPEARYNDLVKEEVTYKVSATEAKKIAKGKPEYAEVIERAKKVIPKDPSVSVSQGNH